MPAPTVPVTIKLAELDGPAIAGIRVTAILDRNELHEGTVIAGATSGLTNASGEVVLDLFPNALEPFGLGAQGSVYRVFAAIPRSKPLSVFAQIPNVPAGVQLHQHLVENEGTPLSASQMAALQAQDAALRAEAAADAAESVSINADDLLNGNPIGQTEPPTATLADLSVEGPAAFAEPLGYNHGGTVTQTAGKTQEVILDTPVGEIVTHAGTMTAGQRLFFQLTNSHIGLHDEVHVWRKSGGQRGAYFPWTEEVAAGHAIIGLENRSSGSLAEAITLGFAVRSGVAAPIVGTVGVPPAPPPISGNNLSFVPNPKSGDGYAFGSRLESYPFGIMPTAVTADPTAADNALKTQYNSWKAAQLVTSIPTIAGGYAIKFPNINVLTRNEAMGYGMLLVVLFAGHDPDAKTIFDALLTTVYARPAYQYKDLNPGDPLNWLTDHLMEWNLVADGSTTPGEAWSALDGEEDIALALLMADVQWGSAGARNYAQLAANRIGAMKHFLTRSDGTIEGMRTPDVNRTSDYMFNHFQAFAVHMGDPFWATGTVTTEGKGNVLDRQLWIADHVQVNDSPVAGLVPDFVEATDTSDPRPGSFGVGDPGGEGHEDEYYWNACRNPWRWATHYVMKGTAGVKTITDRITTFFKTKVDGAGGAVTAINVGYNLDGTDTVGASSGESAAFMAPIMVGAMTDASFQAFLDAMYTWNDTNRIIGYYDGEIQMLSMVVATGNWWMPNRDGTVTPPPPPPPPPPPSDGEGFLTTTYTGGAPGWWGDAREVTYFHVQASGSVNPGSHSGNAGRWIHRGNPSAGTNMVEPNDAERFNLGVDGGGFKYVDVWDPCTIDGVGDSTTAFYACFAVDWSSYYGTLFCNDNAANVGMRLHYVGDDGRFHFRVGNGTSTVVVDSPVINLFGAAGKHVVEVWFDGTDIGIRVDQGTAVTAALGGNIAAGATNLKVGNNQAGTDLIGVHIYHGVILENLFPADADDRNGVATLAADCAGL